MKNRFEISTDAESVSTMVQQLKADIQTTDQCDMAFTKAIYSAFRYALDFHGRSNRRDFWYWILFALALYLICRIIDLNVIAPMMGYMPYEEGSGSPLSNIWIVICIIPTLSLIVRRVHDHDKPGWMALTILPLAWLLIAKGNKEPNQYGA
jgi:uncharacterized membrane protein YhaH (DUF805 family)